MRISTLAAQDFTPKVCFKTSVRFRMLSREKKKKKRHSVSIPEPRFATKSRLRYQRLFRFYDLLYSFTVGPVPSRPIRKEKKRKPFLESASVSAAALISSRQHEHVQHEPSHISLLF